MPAARPQRAPRAAPAQPARLRRSRVALPGGARTTLYVATYDTSEWSARLALLSPPRALPGFCAQRGISDALVGGFFTRASGIPLGELRTRGMPRRFTPFAAPWGDVRACVHIAGGEVAIAPRGELPADPRGDVLQAGPLLVRDGARSVKRGVDPEGFSAGQGQFDSDITRGRYPRAALGVAEGRLLAVCCDGRGRQDAGLTLSELAGELVRLGAHTAINLDGGGSTSLVCDGVLRNRPREEHGVELSHGRPVTSALVFTRR
jgi:hypothetical protein